MAKLSIFTASERILNWFYTCANAALIPRATIQWFRTKGLLSRNKAIKDSANQKRCYILGAGPSLSGVNLNLLVGQPVITVNRLYLLENYRRLSPIFHCALDPAMCSGIYGKEFLDVITSHPSINYLLSGNVPRAFMELDNTYFCQLGFIPSRLVKPFSLHLPSAAFSNVIHYAIELAIYMGFKEIILLGCDFNQFASRTDSHVYDNRVVAKKRTLNMTYELLTHTIMLLQYQYLKEYAEQKGVSIVNATKGSMLDVFEMKNICDLLPARLSESAD